ncbi:flavin-containing monooxygenase [Mycolicibacterium llatzerense]|uniref:flavin-containing monooxygenase n=1 Tax=Mycolicibacterium llatzerense TaxID=280871 RepID=UPI0021B5192E|nr:NAD(P)/FAD-dependent oxidoreductase [Mycolicibacterium llatzerense]MCT7365851.1 cyclohexanone monooxygenase [Mycolicibacterium llatzerense]
MSDKVDHDVIVVGAGFAGLYALYRLRNLGFDVRVVDAAGGIGGTWYWNAYPGARCDVESVTYSYSFSPELDQEWEWTERYATQPEILRYINYVADRFDLRRDVRLGVRIASAVYDENAVQWALTSDAGDEISSRFVVFATGSLSAPLEPTFPGASTFVGESYRTQSWPQRDVDLGGKRVALIGTGSSGMQLLPVVAQDAAQVTVFQRTPNYSAPGRNRVLDAQDVAQMKANYPQRRAADRNARNGVLLDYNDRSGTEMSPAERGAELEKRWAGGGVLPIVVSFRDLLQSPETNGVVQDFIRERIRDRVEDPDVAELLCPSDHMFGTKRPCVDHGYFEAFNRPNVSLVSVRDNPIVAISPAGPVLADGSAYEVDVVVYANGYDAVSGALSRIDIYGRGGRTLRAEWLRGPRTYLGLSFAGFPNMFSIGGPGGPAIFAMMIGLAEQNVDWLADCLVYMRDHGIGAIEASVAAQDEWTADIQRVADSIIVYRQADKSYFTGGNVPGKPRAFPIFAGGMQLYRSICDKAAASGYEGFELTGRETK